MQTIVTIAGWLFLAYAAGGVITALLYVFMRATTHLFDLAVIALVWPLWLFVLINGGK